MANIDDSVSTTDFKARLKKLIQIANRKHTTIIMYHGEYPISVDDLLILGKFPSLAQIASSYNAKFNDCEESDNKELCRKAISISIERAPPSHYTLYLKYYRCGALEIKIIDNKQLAVFLGVFHNYLTYSTYGEDEVEIPKFDN